MESKGQRKHFLILERMEGKKEGREGGREREERRKEGRKEGRGKAKGNSSQRKALALFLACQAPSSPWSQKENRHPSV